VSLKLNLSFNIGHAIVEVWGVAQHRDCLWRSSCM